MLIDRNYEPVRDELIYHYCSPETFNAICTNKTLRLTDVFTMNDFMEVHWGYNIWEKAATKMAQEYGVDFIDEIDKIIHNAGKYGIILACCFSKDGDVLSQWRAYSDDGIGFSIGFDASCLLKLPVKPLEVLYNEENQIKELENIIRALHEVEHESKDKQNDEFIMYCLEIAYDLVALKNPAFQEEKEIRLVHLVNFEKSNESFKLVDKGGRYFGKSKIGSNIKYRMKDGLPVSFIEEDFTNRGEVNPIKEVILGPKNEAALSAISIYLETNGLGNVNVKKSVASYR